MIELKTTAKGVLVIVIRVQYYFWGPNANYNSVHTLSFLIMLSGKERECALTMLSSVGERVNTVL